MKLRRITVVGLFGAGNLGDDLLLRTTCYLLKKQHVDESAIKFLSFGDQIDRIFAGKCLDISARHKVFLPVQIVRMVREVFRTNLLLYVGGGVINKRQRKLRLFWWLFPVIFAILLKKKVVLLGIGVSHDFNDKMVARLIRYIAKNVQLIVVRDTLSKERLIAAGVPTSKVEVAPDLAWCYPFEKDSATCSILTSRAHPVVGMILVNYPAEYCGRGKATDLKFIDTVSECVGELVTGLQHKGVDLVLTNTTSVDYILAKCVAETLLRKHGLHVMVKPSFDIPELCQNIKSMNIMVAMRFHANVLSILFGIPVVPIIYEDKVAELVRESGLEKYAVEYRDFEMGMRGVLPVKEILLRVEEIISDMEKARASVERARTLFLNRTQVYLRIMQEVLNESTD